MGRAPCCDKANVKKGPWSPEEDAKLKAYIEKYGTGGNWIALPQKIGLKRCGKSCRLRWLNYLRPNIKHGDFTEEEDNIILSLYISIGSRWSIIAAQLPGRTDNDIKNYWNTRLKKKLLGRRKQQQQQQQLNGSKEEVPTLSSSALERLQLHMQLQGQQSSSFSLFNNPNLWPKLHPLIQEKLMQTNNLQNLNQQIQFPYNSSIPTDLFHQNASFLHNNTIVNNNNNNNNKNNDDKSVIKNNMEELGSPSLNGSVSSEVSNGGNNKDDDNNNDDNYAVNTTNMISDQGYASMGRVSSFQAELDQLLGNSDKGVNTFGTQGFEGMSGWWSSDANPSSWDASSVLQSENVLYQDYPN